MINLNLKLDKLSFTEYMIQREVETAFRSAGRIKEYKRWIAQAKKNNQPYKDLLLYDKWISSAEERIIRSAKLILERLSKQ